ncbi:MAG: DUF5703 family protein, partial [Actinobacteria bacterium]|nr:DUF5703 family protein [Actinomycetota bacterium]
MQQRAATWEYWEMAFPRGTSREAARVMLTGAAETDHWELDQLRLS